MSKRIMLVAAIPILAVLSLLFASSLGDSAQAQGELEEKPTLRPVDDLVAAPKPEDERQVAVLSLFVVSNEEGKVESVEMRESLIQPGFAPNVFGLSGSWTIGLIGEEFINYGVIDPRLVRVEGDSQSEGEPPHSSFIDTEMEWEVVVPLYDGERDLNVIAIAVIDEDNNIVFSAEIDREAEEMLQIETESLLVLIRERGGINLKVLPPFGLTTGD